MKNSNNMTQEIITFLTSNGANRWSKGDHDRLYLGDAFITLCYAIGATEDRTAFTRSMESHWGRSQGWGNWYIDLNKNSIKKGYLYHTAMKGPDRDITETAVELLEDLTHELWKEVLKYKA